MARKPTIYEIAELTSKTSPYFFSKKTLKFFGQSMSSFKVYKQDDGRYLITAPVIKDGKEVDLEMFGAYVGTTATFRKV